MKGSTEALAQIPLFSGVSKRDLKHLAEHLRDELFKAGETIVTEGQAGGRLFVIRQGTATVQVGSRKVRKIGPGSIIGELSVFDRSPRSATITCETEVMALSLTSIEFLSVLDEQPSVARAVMATMAARLRSVERDLAQH